jgi:DegV family protein with EDD domain
MKVAVVTDSGSNIYQLPIDLPGVFKVPLQIADETVNYQDGEEVSPGFIYQLIAQGKMFKTSMPAVYRIEELFRQIKSEGYDMIFAVCITSGLSSTLSVMQSVAQQLEIPFDFIDCFTTASNQWYLTKRSRELLDEGLNLETIKPLLRDAINHSVTFVIPEDLNHLKRGGRITPMAAALGNLLKIRPVLKVDESTGGKNDAYDKVRTLHKAMQVVIDYALAHEVNDDYLICVAHVLNPQDAELLAKEFRTAFPHAEIFITDLVATVGVHTGLNTVACQYIKKI